MTTITHAIGNRGAHLRDAFRRLLHGTGQMFAVLDAAIRISSAMERRQDPNPADLKVLGLKDPLPRFH